MRAVNESRCLRATGPSIKNASRTRIGRGLACWIDRIQQSRCKYMKTSNSLVCKVSLQLAGIALCSVALGAGSAGAETFRYGGSTATIEQSGGGGSSRTEVTRYKDGQKIVTRNGNSTDITIQRGNSSPPLDYDWGPSQSSADRFDRESMEERFSRFDMYGEDFDDCYDCTTSSARASSFKRRMLDRMRSPFGP